MKEPQMWAGGIDYVAPVDPSTLKQVVKEEMVLLTAKTMQRTAVFVTFGGLVTSLITTFLPLWKTMNSDLNEVENWYSGLWHMCLYTEEVGVQCKTYDSLLGLPVDLQIARVLMLVSVCIGALALLVALPGLDGIHVCLEQPGKRRRLLVLGGVLAWVSGFSTLVPVSIVAYNTVVEFWDRGFPDVMPRWEHGEAMFSGWFGGLALITGGTLFFVAVCMADYDTHTHCVTNNKTHVTHGTQHYRKTEVL
ncbi:putative claudin-24 [Nerophis ophidion]|uniref:putative claudin-24 n=1 Tax=Nerophis ophidion TaxID=159077 RepID=UPI002AE07FDB|nr:putative claudin-24 [Nerophis ophidion]XP_061762473.1 putative claudin-24 [Nerophis ophidion]